MSGSSCRWGLGQTLLLFLTPQKTTAASSSNSQGPPAQLRARGFASGLSFPVWKATFANKMSRGNGPGGSSTAQDGDTGMSGMVLETRAGGRGCALGANRGISAVPRWPSLPAGVPAPRLHHFPSRGGKCQPQMSHPKAWCCPPSGPRDRGLELLAPATRETSGPHSVVSQHPKSCMTGASQRPTCHPPASLHRDARCSGIAKKRCIRQVRDNLGSPAPFLSQRSCLNPRERAAVQPSTLPFSPVSVGLR